MKLTKARRKKLPRSSFGLPGARGYPMPDKNHARLAKSGASRAERVGNITEGEEKQIDAKADRILGEGKDRRTIESESHSYNWRNRHGRARRA